jgi:tripartite-type tricarboxylate transporter receptor subunit TctC
MTLLCAGRRAWLRGLALALAASAFAAPASAQTYPERPVRLIVPFSPGGGSDVAARIAAQCMGGPLGQTVVVENRPGAGGTLGTEQLVRAAPDGHTLGLLTTSSAVLNVFLYPRLSFDMRTSLAGIAEVGRSPSVFAVRRGLAEDLAGLRAAGARAGLTFSSGGNGTGPHLAGTMLGRALGVEVTHVPFRGSGQALTAVVAGQVDFIIEAISVLLPQVQDGTVKAVALAGSRRDPLLPQLPTTAEIGLPGLEVENFYALFAPARTPPAVLTTVASALQRGLAAPDCQRRLGELGIGPGTTEPAAFASFWQAELDRWGPIVARSGAQVE